MSKKNRISFAVSLLIITWNVQQPAWSDEVQLTPVEIQGERAAADSAPSQTSLLAVQPQSVISRSYITENAEAGANYSDIVSIAPSVMSLNPNGPGLMENQSLTIRGFQDGQYNVTFDGIPWGDSNDFTHHSTVYFMPQDMESISIDRGPGEANTFGNATFGGTIAMSSKALADQAASSVYGSLGSWNTRLFGIQHESGYSKEGDDSRYYMSFKDLSSSGFLTNAGQTRQNFFAKGEKEISSDTVLTAVAMYNHTHQHTPYGATTSQEAQYGYNFGLTNDPNSEANSAWNYDELHTDFEYLGLKTRQSDWNIDNKVYTFAYYHKGYYGWNTGSVSLMDTQADGGTSNGPNNVPGGQMHMNYRSVGDMFNANRDLGPGKVEVGFWYDHQNDNRFEQQVDWTQGGTPNNAPGTVVDGTYGPGVDRDQNNKLITIQTYAKYDWTVMKDWQMNFGAKYSSFERDLNAAVNQKSLTPYTGSAKWSRVLPSLVSRYALSPNASVYAQYSEGFLAPNLNVFYNTSPNLNSVQPTTTKNYQLGANWSSADVNGGIDVYHIDSTNLSSGVACPAGMVGSCFNVTGGVKFDGVEMEGTRRLGGGWSLYGNFAVNNYTTSDGSVLQNTPKNNAALAIMYQRGPWYASLSDKYVASRYSNVDASGNNIYMGGFATANLALRYKLENSSTLLPKGSKLTLKIDNLFNREGPMASINTTSGGLPLFFVIPPRSFQAGFDIPF